MSEGSTKKRIAVGCGVLAVLGGIAIIVAGFFVFKTFKTLKADAADPGPRAL